jgi:hypothetical protein
VDTFTGTFASGYNGSLTLANFETATLQVTGDFSGSLTVNNPGNLQSLSVTGTVTAGSTIRLLETAGVSGTGVLSNASVGSVAGKVVAASIVNATIGSIAAGGVVTAQGQGTTSNVSIGTLSGSFTAPEDGAAGSGVMSGTTISSITSTGMVSTGSISGMTVGTADSGSTITAQGQGTTIDRACRGLVGCLSLDEIFFRRLPVPMGVEPHSLAWPLGARAADRTGATWAEALSAWPQVEDVAADGGGGLALGLELAAQRRAAAALSPARAVPLRVRLGAFHTRREGGRALRQTWQQAEARWAAAEAVERAKARVGRGGADRRGLNRRLACAWRRAMAAFEGAQRQERAWRRAKAALAVFRLDGALSDRAWAAAEPRAAAAELPGPRWAKARRVLLDERSLTFLGRLHEGLAADQRRPEVRAALVAGRHAHWPYRTSPRANFEKDLINAAPFSNRRRLRPPASPRAAWPAGRAWRARPATPTAAVPTGAAPTASSTGRLLLPGALVASLRFSDLIVPTPPIPWNVSRKNEKKPHQASPFTGRGCQARRHEEGPIPSFGGYSFTLQHTGCAKSAHGSNGLRLYRGRGQARSCGFSRAFRIVAAAAAVDTATALIGPAGPKPSSVWRHHSESPVTATPRHQRSQPWTTPIRLSPSARERVPSDNLLKGYEDFW